MLQNYTRQNYKIALLLIGLSISTAGYGQSLGDVARQERQKQQAKKADASHKVVTNEDIPEHPESASDSEAETSSGTSGSDSAGDASFRSASEVAKSGEQWKAAILTQKGAIANFQSQLDKLNDSIHFVEANRFSNGAQYNQYQLKKKQEAERAQKQLDEQKKKLVDMQEAARKAGFGSSVYEP